MATPQQFEFFKTLHMMEENRYIHLQGKAKFYLGIASTYIAIVAFKITDVEAFANRFHVSLVLFLALAAVMATSLLFTVTAMNIRHYDRVADPLQLIRALGDRPPSDTEFLDDRIIDYAAATDFFFVANNRVALQLQIAAWSIAASALGQVILLIAAVANAAKKG